MPAGWIVAAVSVRTCIDCGRRIARSKSRCIKCARPIEAELQSRQWYRAAYNTAIYRSNRRLAFKRAGGQCERVLTSGRRCGAMATEANHIRPLSKARTMVEALYLCHVDNLEAVCSGHNPRGRARVQV